MICRENQQIRIHAQIVCFSAVDRFSRLRAIQAVREGISERGFVSMGSPPSPSGPRGQGHGPMVLNTSRGHSAWAHLPRQGAVSSSVGVWAAPTRRSVVRVIYGTLRLPVAILAGSGFNGGAVGCRTQGVGNGRATALALIPEAT